MYFVYWGYESQEGTHYKLSTFKSEEQLLRFRKEFDEDFPDNMEYEKKVFRVIKGTELKLVPKTIVTHYGFEE